VNGGGDNGVTNNGAVDQSSTLSISGFELPQEKR
jgi:hypothetical protein